MNYLSEKAGLYSQYRSKIFEWPASDHLYFSPCFSTDVNIKVLITSIYLLARYKNLTIFGPACLAVSHNTVHGSRDGMNLSWQQVVPHNMPVTRSNALHKDRRQKPVNCRNTNLVISQLQPLPDKYLTNFNQVNTSVWSSNKTPISKFWRWSIRVIIANYLNLDKM